MYRTQIYIPDPELLGASTGPDLPTPTPSPHLALCLPHIPVSPKPQPTSPQHCPKGQPTEAPSAGLHPGHHPPRCSGRRPGLPPGHPHPHLSTLQPPGLLLSPSTLWASQFLPCSLHPGHQCPLPPPQCSPLTCLSFATSFARPGLVLGLPICTSTHVSAWECLSLQSLGSPPEAAVQLTPPSLPFFCTSCCSEHCLPLCLTLSL